MWTRNGVVRILTVRLSCRMRCLALPLLFATFAVSAQSYSSNGKRYKDKFNFELMPDEHVERTWFHYVVTATDDGLWRLRTFYPETGRMTALITYADEQLTRKSGPATYWYDDGRKYAEGNHVDNQRFGVWTELRGTGSYKNGIEDGPWVLEERNAAKDSGQFVHGKRTGLWLSTDSLGRVRARRWYKAGKLDGEWIGYDAVTGDSTQRIYRADSLIGGGDDDPVIVERMPCSRVCDEIVRADARAFCTDTTIRSHLARTLHYPKEPMNLGVSGMALFTFTVEKDGTVSGIVALNGLCRDIEDECIRILKEMPEWVPGEQRGKNVRVQYNQPVKFTLR